MRVETFLETIGRQNDANNIDRTTFETITRSPTKISKASASSSTKFHRAAIDGYIDMLCDASKRETNLPADDEHGLSPTLLAARHGHLDALRILVGRGGDPERCANDGSSALHLAAARNHLNCVSFLVNFGVNMWALDNELHTAKDVAAIEQRKEVLDYLDQMMAKQSALNTKNVQKLKEKAKISAEKRLKQMRKAQLKAIKQVEKDERYLVKLSNNRRILKAAHSISDIKLVGRSTDQAINFSPSDLHHHHHHHHMETNNRHRIRPYDNSPSLNSSGSRLSSSASIANFFNQKLHMDLLGQTRPNRSKALYFRATPLGSTTDDSAYSSSSISSTSNGGYLSSCGGLAASGMPAMQPNRRPKYSDLVAVGAKNQKLTVNSTPAQAQALTQTPASQTQTKKQQQEQFSLKSNSTIGTRLRGVAGVSRKVQLKRLLLVSSSNLNERPTSKESKVTKESQIETTAKGIASKSNKLCNVQPAIKLKLTCQDQSPHQNASSQRSIEAGPKQVNQPQHEVTQTGGSIKWPPAPSMSRAVSEPDFGAAMRLAAKQASEDEEDDSDFTCSNESLPNELERERDLDRERELVRVQESPAGEFTKLAETNISETKLDLSASIATNAPSCHNTKNDNNNNEPTTRDESQHHLLTQCLSQLKLRHAEALTKNQTTSRDASNQQQLVRPSKVASGAISSQRIHNQTATTVGGNCLQPTTAPVFTSNSDELLQHQLSAGEFPLKPSIIKQHKHQQQQQQQQQQLSHNQLSQPTLAANNCEPEKHVTTARTSCFQFAHGPKMTTISVDSIGSAGSLVKRNSHSSSTSTKSTTDPDSSVSPTSSSLASYCSSYSSSFDATAAAKQTLGDSNAVSQPTANLTSAQDQRHCNHHHHRHHGENPSQQHTMHVSQRAYGVIHGHESSQDGNAHYQILQQSAQNETIETFLLSNGLFDLSEVFSKERIDLEALMLLSENDLKSLNILLGPRRKLLKAIECRLSRIEVSQIASTQMPLPLTNNKASQQQSGPMYVMVDTPL